MGNWGLRSVRHVLACTTLSILGIALSGCPGPNGPPKPVTDDHKKITDIRGGESVYVIEAKGQPLIVDWQPEARGDLEIAMKEGIAVVGFDQRGLRLLKDCHLDGKYGFIGMNTKEQVVRLMSAEEVKANLPGAGLGILAKLGAELGRSETVEIAILMIGKKKTTWERASKKDLKGQCQGATHFVRGATIGAFAMKSGKKGKASTVAEIFGAGASASTENASALANADGFVEACKKASPESDSPPSQCGALIRLELVGLEEKAIKQDAPAQGPALATNEESEACPEGFVFAEGKCTKPEAVAHHVCKYGDVRDCSVQCEKGNAESCDALGVMFVRGEGVAANPTEGTALFIKACKAELANGCYNLALSAYNGTGMNKDAAGAVVIAEKACNANHALGCSFVGRSLLFGDGVAQDLPRAAKLLAVGCKGGDKSACSDLGVMVHGGQGMPRNDKLAAELFKMACDGGATIGCNNLGYMVEVGEGVAKDVKAAATLYGKACQQSDAECIWWGVAHQVGIGVKKDKKIFETSVRKACDAARKYGATSSGQLIACSMVQTLFGEQAPVDQQFLKNAAQVWGPNCKQGIYRDCTQLGVAVLALGDKPLAKQAFGGACKGGDPWACELLKHPKVR